MIIEIKSDISKNTTFTSDNEYVIVGEIHVLSGVTLTIQNNVRIGIRNGRYTTKTINLYALIFDTGSCLQASTFYMAAVDSNNKQIEYADNGGLWFVGSAANAEKDGVKSAFGTVASTFKANQIYTYYLGSTDLVKSKDGPSQDQDSITALGVGNNEWNIKEVLIRYSGDNGFDVVQSNIILDKIDVIYPGEDALNMQSGQAQVLKYLKLLVPLTDVKDRDIFDFEQNNGVSYLRIAKGCFVKMEGIFGDQLKLVSKDLPQPTDKLYKYEGTTKNGQSYVYSTVDLS